jgi:sigma-E factor negative regulatory protein RseC
MSLEEVGIVQEIKGPMAIVAVERKNSCEACPGGSLCKAVGGGEGRIEALNNAHAKVDDTVRVALKPYTYLKGAALVYGVPSLALIIGAVIGKEHLSRLFPSLDPDLASAVGGFGLFALSFLVMKIVSGRLSAKKEYMPVVEEILNQKR